MVGEIRTGCPLSVSYNAPRQERNPHWCPRVLREVCDVPDAETTDERSAWALVRVVRDGSDDADAGNERVPDIAMVWMDGRFDHIRASAAEVPAGGGGQKMFVGECSYAPGPEELCEGRDHSPHHRVLAS